MIRRPYLSKAVLLAGFLWLGVFLAAPPWDQGRTGSPFSIQEILLSRPALAAEPKQPHSPSLKSPDKVSTLPETAKNPMSNLVRLLAGGLLSGVLWSVLFGYPFYTYWPDRPWPLGLLDLSVLATFFYLGYLVIKTTVRGRYQPLAPTCPVFLRCQNTLPLILTVNQRAERGIQDITAADPAFDVQAFGVLARRLMENLHAAWNQQDLEGLNGEVGEDLLAYLCMGLKILHMREEISRLEDLHLNRLEVTAAGREGDQEFIILTLEGELMDYILKKSSYKLVSGSLTYPTALRETWRFERTRGQARWRLVDIQDY